MRESISSRNGRSSFWAVLLIAVGAIWLLAQLGVLTAVNFTVLARLWPVILIVVGVQLLLGRTSRPLTTLLLFATLAVVLLAMVVGPALGWAQAPEVQASQFSEPVGTANSAEVELGFGLGAASVVSMTDSSDLIDVDTHYYGDADFEVDINGDMKSVTLRYNSQSQDVFIFPFFSINLDSFNNDNLYTNVRLSPELPLDLTINGGVGEADIDLSGLNLTTFDLNSGVGRVELVLPVVSGIDAHINSGVGETFITVPQGSAFSMDINGGIGKTTIDLPDNAAIRIAGESGLGALHMPSFMQSAGEDTWESVNFSGSANEERIVIDFNGGLGELVIQ